MQTSSKNDLAAIKLISIMDRLSQRVTIEGLTLPNSYQKRFGDLLFGKHSKLSVNDPSWDQEIIKLKKYWAQRMPADGREEEFVSFFGIEALGKESYQYELFDSKDERKKKHRRRCSHISENNVRPVCR